MNSNTMLSSIFDSPLLETALCLVLAYALLSLLVGTLTEIVNSYFNERGRQLFGNISRLFNDGINVNFGQLLYNHPAIANMRKDLQHLPQYIGNEIFSQTLIDVIGNYSRDYKFDESKNAILLQEGSDDPFQRFMDGVKNMAHTDLKLLLLNMAQKSQALAGKDGPPLEELDKQIQQWYQEQMDHATGWFKDLMRTRLRIIALLVAVGLNVNSVHLFKTLYSNPQLRATLIPVAERLADNYAKAQKDSVHTSMQEAAYQAVMQTQDQLKKGNPDSGFKAVHGILLDLQKIDSMWHLQDSQRTVNIQRANAELSILAGLGIPIGWHKGIPPLTWTSPLADSAAKTVLDQQQGQKGAKDQTSPEDQKDKRSNFWMWTGRWFWYIVGILITAFSISAGAPFWFDLLLKFVNVRRAGKKPQE